MVMIQRRWNVHKLDYSEMCSHTREVEFNSQHIQIQVPSIFDKHSLTLYHSIPIVVRYISPPLCWLIFDVYSFLFLGAFHLFLPSYLASQVLAISALAPFGSFHTCHTRSSITSPIHTCGSHTGNPSVLYGAQPLVAMGVFLRFFEAFRLPHMIHLNAMFVI